MTSRIASTQLAETSLYAPVEAFLEDRGFEAKGEICGCDIVAVRPGEPPIVVINELKLPFTLESLLPGLFGLNPFVERVFADGGYAGKTFSVGMAKACPTIRISIVKRSETAQGFQVLPKRCVVERTIGWLNRCRRLAEYWECLSSRSLAFLQLASIRVMLRKLCDQ